MGFLEALGLATGSRTAGPAVVAGMAAIGTPRKEAVPAFASIAGMIEADTSLVAVTKSEALKVPSLSNGVTLFSSIAQQLPLSAGENAPAEVATFLSTLDPDVAPGWTIAQTLQDLIFSATGYWLVMEEYASPTTCPRYIRWTDAATVAVDPQTGDIHAPGHVNPARKDETFSPDQFIRFDGLMDGLLTRGAEAIRTALANVRQVRRYAENPTPSIVLSSPEGADVLPDDVATGYLTNLATAARTRGYAYVGGLKIDVQGWSAREIQLVEARQLDALEMARLLSVHPRYVAAPTQGSDLTYQNLAEIRRDLFEVGGLATWLVPIEQRLSLSNPDRMFARRQVTPTGTRVKFESEFFFSQLQGTTPEVPA